VSIDEARLIDKAAQTAGRELLARQPMTREQCRRMVARSQTRKAT